MLNVCLYIFNCTSKRFLQSLLLHPLHGARNVGGVDFHLLYDKGAAANCLNLATFNWYFSNTKQLNHATGVRGAGCNDLGLYGVYALPVKYKKKTVIGKFMVSESLDVDLFGIDIIKELVISHDIKSQQVLSIVSMPGVLVNT